MKINQKFIPASNTFTRPGIKMDPEYITIHETDNTNRGADDEAHANLQYNGNSRQASWHFTVDEDSIYQSIPTDEVAWHAGDGNGPGNMKSIAIEICVNSDGDFNKAVDNAVWLTKHIMDEQNIPASKVVQHNHWSGKNCPRNLRSGDKGIDWDDFINMVKGYKVEKPETPIVEAEIISRDESKSLSIVDWMISKGMDSSYANRAKLAKEYGISNYTGTASQNIDLLDKLKKGKPAAPKEFAPSKKGDMKTNSIVEYLQSIGVNSSYSNRKKLAKQYGISGYKGTGSQNLQLLKAMRSGKKVELKNKTTLKVGSKIKIKSGAKKYATGETIPSYAKGKSYTIMQVKSDRVLLKEIMSWVKKDDVQ